MKHILVIEPSESERARVEAALPGDVQASFVGTATEARKVLESLSFDLVLLETELPDQDGIELCADLRSKLPLASLPIVFISSRVETESLVRAFQAGADDFLRKPFDTNELRARIEARIMRMSRSHDLVWHGNLRLATGVQRAVVTDADGEWDLHLTPNEFKILYLLASNSGQILSRSEILRHVWGRHTHVVERTVDKHVCSLRRKLGPHSSYILSAPGRGYSFSVGDATGGLNSGEVGSSASYGPAGDSPPHPADILPA